MKRYTSFKEVDAAKIDHLILGEGQAVDQVTVMTVDGEQIPTTREWLLKHSDNETKVLAGGYFVRYADGYESWSPAEAFESGYKEITEDGHEALKINSVTEVLGEEFNFSAALVVLDEGKRVARKGWNGKDMYIELQVPTETSKMTLPYIFMKTAQGDLVPWLASQSDLLANDWTIVE